MSRVAARRVVVLGLARALRERGKTDTFNACPPRSSYYAEQQRGLPSVASWSLALQATDRLDRDFEVGKVCGTGSFATVLTARCRVDGQSYALKVVGEDAKESGAREARVLAAMGSHPHVVRYFGAWADAETVCLKLELLGQTLKSWLEVRLPKQDASTIARHIASGLAFVHSRGITHADLAPANVLSDGNDWKLCDFGLSQRVDAYEPTSEGHSLYRAPNTAQDPAKADVWSLGVVCYELVVPFRTGMERVRTLEAPPPLVAPSGSTPLAALVPTMTQPDPARRPTAAQVATALGDWFP